MAKIPEFYNIGSLDEITPEKLIQILQDMYQELAVAINKKPDFFERTTDGQATDTALATGSINLNTTTLKTEMLVAHPTATTVTWKQI